MSFNEKQLAILNVAEKLICEKGFESASIREISTLANVNLAMVSYYFGSKEKLLEAIFILKLSEFKLELNNSQQNSENAQVKLISIADAYLNKIFRNINFHKILIKEMDYLDSSVAFEQIKITKTENLNYITAIIEKGIADNEFNKNVTAHMFISLVVGTVSYYVLNEKYYRYLWNLAPEQDFTVQTKERIKNKIIYELKAILKND